MPTTIALLLLAALPIGQKPEFAPQSSADPRPASGCPGCPASKTSPPDHACLHDVSFADPRHGWAVGDYGTILHTDDGGEHWSPQNSGVICTLNSVCFVDARTGWAAGGMAWPYLHDTSGVVLATRDGGLTWLREPVLLPALHKIRFVTDRQGWAIGCSSAMYPCGVFLTRDGGRSWLPAGGAGGAIGLTSGDLYDGRNAILGGGAPGAPACGSRVGGQLATISGGDFARRATGDCPDFRISENGTVPFAARGQVNGTVPFAGNLRGVNAMQVVPSSYGWLAGDGGWIALTGDRGNSWRPPLGKPPACAALFDFAALAVGAPAQRVGGKCWLAGTPGTRIFFTPDAGRSWSAAPTGITVPLRAITFVDDQHGWAVGQLGTVLATSDGGQTWHCQRAGVPAQRVGGAPGRSIAGRGGVPAQRVGAVMAVAGRAEDLPLELIARACKDQGFFGVGEVIGRDEPESGRICDAPLADRVHQAMLHVGANGGEMAWGFPLRPAELQLPAQTIMESWNRVHGGHADEALRCHLVRQIRMWRPNVLLVAAGAASAERADGLDEIVRQSVVAAVKLAGDPTYLADQFLAAGCGPWNVQRVFLVTRRGARTAGQEKNVADAGSEGSFLSRVEERAAGQEKVFNADDWSPQFAQSWTDAALPARALLANDWRERPGAVGVQLVGGAGVPALAGFADPHKSGTPAFGHEADIMFDIAPSAGENPRPQDRALDGLALRRQIESIFAHLEQDPQGAVDKLAKGGELPQGIDPAEAAVLTFRIAERLFHSGNWDLADKAFALLIERHPDSSLAREAIIRRLQYLADASGRRNSTVTSEQALLFARQIETACPDLFASPAIRYPLAAVYRRQGQDVQAERLYALDHPGVDRDVWWNCARGERWLLDRKGPPPRQMVSCMKASERPHLDGRLDEPMWKKCAAIELKSPQSDDHAWPAKVLVAHDEKFLYVAVQCRQAPGARYETTSQPRPRDPDLSQHDRVDIFLDIDRTYASYYHLSIDHRGWAADACCGDSSWNPKWFVAAQTAAGVWTAEAAVPLSELGATIVPGKTVWAVGVQRTVPGVGFQSWTVPAAPRVVPEGFGWVEFQ